MQVQKFCPKTFGAVALAYKDDHFQEVRPGTLRCYRPALNRAIQEFGDNLIEEIKPAEIKAFLRKCGKTYAQNTVCNQKSVLQQIFDYAIVDLSILDVNPCVRIKVPSNLRKTPREALEPEQVAEINSTQPDEFLLAYLILYTGARLGEALALQWSDVDFLHKRLYIRKAVHFNGNQPYVGNLKTSNSKRVVPLLNPLANMLILLAGKSEEYIIGGVAPITRSALTRRWEKFCRTHNMVTEMHREPTPANRHAIVWLPTIDRHQIRHEYATMAFEAGLEPKTVQMLMGHECIQTTLTVYTHFRIRQLKKAEKQLNDFIETEMFRDYDLEIAVCE